MFHRGGSFDCHRLVPRGSFSLPASLRENLPQLTIPPAGNNFIIIVQWLGRSRQYQAQVVLGCGHIHRGVLWNLASLSVRRGRGQFFQVWPQHRSVLLCVNLALSMHSSCTSTRAKIITSSRNFSFSVVTKRWAVNVKAYQDDQDQCGSKSNGADHVNEQAENICKKWASMKYDGL